MTGSSSRTVGPPDDVVVARLAVAEVGLLLDVLAYERQTPDDGVHGPAIDGPAGQLLGREGCRILGLGRLAYQQQADDERGYKPSPFRFLVID